MFDRFLLRFEVSDLLPPSNPKLVLTLADPVAAPVESTADLRRIKAEGYQEQIGDETSTCSSLSETSLRPRGSSRPAGLEEVRAIACMFGKTKTSPEDLAILRTASGENRKSGPPRREALPPPHRISPCPRPMCHPLRMAFLRPQDPVTLERWKTARRTLKAHRRSAAKANSKLLALKRAAQERQQAAYEKARERNRAAVSEAKRRQREAVRKAKKTAAAPHPIAPLRKHVRPATTPAGDVKPSLPAAHTNVHLGPHAGGREIRLRPIQLSFESPASRVIRKDS